MSTQSCCAGIVSSLHSQLLFCIYYAQKKRVETGNEATAMHLCRDLKAGDNSWKTWNFFWYAFQLLREHSCSISAVFGKKTIAVTEFCRLVTP